LIGRGVLLPICFSRTATGGPVAVHRQFERAQQFGHVLDLVEDRPQRQRSAALSLAASGRGKGFMRERPFVYFATVQLPVCAPAIRPAAGPIPDYVRLPTGHQPVANP
jgi:hypothetical protein